MKELQYVIVLENKQHWFVISFFFLIFSVSPINVGLFPKSTYEAVRCIDYTQG